MTFDPTKPVQTRDGRKARILCTDFQADGPIVAAVSYWNGEEVLVRYQNTGIHFTARYDQLDLINIPEEVVKYVNVYQGSKIGLLYNSEAEARDAQRGWTRLSYLAITFRDGKPVKAEVVG